MKMKWPMIRIWSLGVMFWLGMGTVIVQGAEQNWISLLNDKDKTGWHLRREVKDGWTVEDHVLVNSPPSVDIVSDVPQGDCEMHVEFLVPKGSNSGVYLQGRYEIQILDSAGQPPESHICGAVYGRVAPKVNAAKPAGEWQTFDITFHQAVVDGTGKKTKNARVTLVHNGIKTIDDAEVEGPTGAAIGSDEGKPAGVMLQGDHGQVSFRNIKMRPL